MIYSYTFPGMSSDMTIVAASPAVMRHRAGSGYLSFSLRENRAGASPSRARVIIMDVTAYSEAVMVEKPAMMRTPLKTWGTNLRWSLLSASTNGLSFGLNSPWGTIETAKPIEIT
ncbi:hypothetical protein D3C73_1297420 [compost metagenome]